MRVSFRFKIILTIVLVVWLTQIATLWSVLTTSRLAFEGQVQGELGTAARVLDRLLAVRAQQLLGNVSVLAADFGFKAAAASRDASTIDSALENHGARVNADLVGMLTPGGDLMAGTIPNFDANAFGISITEQVERDGFLIMNGQFGDRAYQLVLVSVRAPVHIGWVLMGFAIDRNTVLELRDLTGVEVSLLGKAGSGARSLEPSIVASTLPVPVHSALKGLSALDTDTVAGGVTMGDAHYFTRAHRLPSRFGVLTAYLQQPATTAFSLYQTLRIEAIALGIVASLLAAVLTLPLARSISSPVRKLAIAAGKVAGGDYESPVEINTHDELASLAQSFNEMQRGIAERERRIALHAHYDELTGLPNLILARDRLTGALERASRGGHGLGIALISIDHFKGINGSLGHDTGDAVLVALANRLTKRLRGSDSIARASADEFLVMLEKTDVAAAGRVLDEILVTLKAPIEVSQVVVNLSFTAGIAAYPDHGDQAEDLLRRVEIAVQNSRDAGTQVGVYELGHDDTQRRQLQIIGALRQAIATNELSLVYQPKVALPSGEVTEAEALVRWIHPELGFIPPDEFIPLAERSGNITLLTAWLLDVVMNQLAEWRDQGLVVSVGVNLSAFDLLDRNLPTRVTRGLEQRRLAADRLILEVTESAVMRDTVIACQILEQIRELGIHVAVDDFGTGYSSLAQLKTLPVDELKIDKSFVLEVTENRDDALIVKSTIALAHSLGLKVTAEGVENAAASELLASYGCDKLQGYHFSKPLNAHDFVNWVHGYRPQPHQISSNLQLGSVLS